MLATKSAEGGAPTEFYGEKTRGAHAGVSEGICGEDEKENTECLWDFAARNFPRNAREVIKLRHMLRGMRKIWECAGGPSKGRGGIVPF